MARPTMSMKWNKVARKCELWVGFVAWPQLLLLFIGKCAYKTKRSVNATLKSHCGGKVDVAKATRRSDFIFDVESLKLMLEINF